MDPALPDAQLSDAELPDAELLATAQLCRIEVNNLRNLERVSITLSPTINVLIGDNGQGKTSILEAIYLVATSRSFRTHRLRELIRHGTAGGNARAWIADPLGTREQLVGLTATARRILVDGQKPASMAQYAMRTPVVVFHPGEIELTMGSALGRRTLLDRVALFFDARSYHEHHAYVQAMKARQKLLQADVSDAHAIEAYEHLMARHGATLTRFRSEAVEQLTRAVMDVFRQVAPVSLDLSMRYQPGGSVEEHEAERELFQHRQQDARRQSAGFGPHRDDFLLELDGCPVRASASQGQHRLLTLSLKIAEMVCVGKGSGFHPLLLLDDVSSELDAERTEAFFRLLGHRKDQVFLTTTRPEMLGVFEKTMGEGKVFSVVSGAVSDC